MTTSDPVYDEFGMFQENAEEAGIPWRGAPVVVRRTVEVRPGYALSALVWGDGPPEVVLVHGAGQNAHTWDSVALALDRPLVAVDLPGHGHSARPAEHRVVDPWAIAGDLDPVVDALAPRARVVVGMSLGGLATLAWAARHPDPTRHLVIVDVTPGVDREKTADIAAFLGGPARFDSFDAILAHTVAFNPTRSRSSLRRGVLHNAVRQPDGSWTWRHQLGRVPEGDPGPGRRVEVGALWDDVGSTGGPLRLVRGGRSPVVSDADVAELCRRCPQAVVTVVEDAGHSVQGDQPVALARIIEEELSS